MAKERNKWQLEPTVMSPSEWSRVENTFLTVLSKTGSATSAAVACGHSCKFFRRQREKNLEFAERWEEAARIAFDKLENAARIRATDGVRKYVISRGALVPNPNYDPELHPPEDKYLYERVYSDPLLMFLMEATDPEKKYGRKRLEIEPVTMDELLREQDEMKPDEPGPMLPIN